MTAIALTIMDVVVERSSEDAPVWAEFVPRWQQIDAASFAIAEAWQRWTTAGVDKDLLHPHMFMLANRRASNAADAAFAATGAYSPGRFVATLPSVTLAAMLQITGWEGPMFCLQAGEQTLRQALAEAGMMAQAQRRVGIVTYQEGLAGVRVGYLVVEATGGRSSAVELCFDDLADRYANDEALEAYLFALGTENAS
jgi:hypothetical protein